ncbi:hypothetical protein ACA758_02835 [Mycoplasmopsis agassizii]|uniref:hypothetical protein n=1 Tax=Mycoplasmopsis agassizii TaxID=33922 RepID=UPI003528E2D1
MTKKGLLLLSSFFAIAAVSGAAVAAGVAISQNRSIATPAPVVVTDTDYLKEATDALKMANFNKDKPASRQYVPTQVFEKNTLKNLGLEKYSEIWNEKILFFEVLSTTQNTLTIKVSLRNAEDKKILLYDNILITGFEDKNAEKESKFKIEEIIWSSKKTFKNAQEDLTISQLSSLNLTEDNDVLEKLQEISPDFKKQYQSSFSKGLILTNVLFSSDPKDNSILNVNAVLRLNELFHGIKFKIEGFKKQITPTEKVALDLQAFKASLEEQKFVVDKTDLTAADFYLANKDYSTTTQKKELLKISKEFTSKFNSLEGIGKGSISLAVTTNNELQVAMNLKFGDYADKVIFYFTNFKEMLSEQETAWKNYTDLVSTLSVTTLNSLSINDSALAFYNKHLRPLTSFEKQLQAVADLINADVNQFALLTRKLSDLNIIRTFSVDDTDFDKPGRLVINFEAFVDNNYRSFKIYVTEFQPENVFNQQFRLLAESVDNNLFNSLITNKTSAVIASEFNALTTVKEKKDYIHSLTNIIQAHENTFYTDYIENVKLEQANQNVLISFLVKHGNYEKQVSFTINSLNLTYSSEFSNNWTKWNQEIDQHIQDWNKNTLYIDAESIFNINVYPQNFGLSIQNLAEKFNIDKTYWRELLTRKYGGANYAYNIEYKRPATTNLIGEIIITIISIDANNIQRKRVIALTSFISKDDVVAQRNYRDRIELLKSLPTKLEFSNKVATIDNLNEINRTSDLNKKLELLISRLSNKQNMDYYTFGLKVKRFKLEPTQPLALSNKMTELKLTINFDFGSLEVPDYVIIITGVSK